MLPHWAAPAGLAFGRRGKGFVARREYIESDAGAGDVGSDTAGHRGGRGTVIAGEGVDGGIVIDGGTGNSREEDSCNGEEVLEEVHRVGGFVFEEVDIFCR